MVKQYFIYLGLGLSALAMAGCTSTSSGGGVETRAYVDTRNRVDQDMAKGNQGYIMGTPKPVDPSKMSKTREVFTVEFTKNPGVTPEDFRKPQEPAPSVSIDVPSESSQSQRESVEEPVATSKEMNAGGSMREYVVQNGDTLQKISKKFYNSYAKWNKIYQANKDIIPHPNKIKKGLTIRIPE